LSILRSWPTSRLSARTDFPRFLPSAQDEQIVDQL
jgi:hypothetical protein